MAFLREVRRRLETARQNVLLGAATLDLPTLRHRSGREQAFREVAAMFTTKED